ncbi:uncharacterized protein PFL1_05580 [Pseudozyma flocculosa PF-1]|uniref:BZIP domain-containing protein n=2 Tax=Pseudozyma flocculosa TaxID=84751 RepID=A0A5C3FBX9_9BASI|nr:uncharacterized protein PFL1_05580 [Pseudozyma flocculosa PF-1]EPQ26946.1 hypothetical protein PFL1_05580 [Pseudozyma flocculosa PF-1]SPO41145.1 uncharacterized protein PSFLO_06627 [Pseudozyma flocculosa]
MKVSQADAAKPQVDVNDAERLKQIAKRKEQNRNAQRRLRERKEEYTMQLEAQVAELHRRSQTQEEHSHYLREILERIRMENQVLSQQLAMVSGSPETVHRSSVDSSAPTANVAQPFATNRPRHSSESYAASSQGLSLWPPSIDPSHTTDMPRPFGGNLAPHETITHSQSPLLAPAPAQPRSATGLPAAAGGFTFPTILHPAAAPISRASEATNARHPHPHPQQHLRQPPQHPHPLPEPLHRASASPLASASDGMLSPMALRGSLNRYGSGQTEITVPSDSSESDPPAAKMRCRGLSVSRKQSGPMDVDMDPAAASSSVAASTTMPASLNQHRSGASSSMQPEHGTRAPEANSMFSRGLLEHRQAAGSSAASASGAAAINNSDQCMHSWLNPGNSGIEHEQDLVLANMPSQDVSGHLKPIGATPGALGLTTHGDGWTISPWVNFTSSPLDQVDSRQSVRLDGAGPTEYDSFGRPTSLASRRGFSGKLELGAHVLEQ